MLKRLSAISPAVLILAGMPVLVVTQPMGWLLFAACAGNGYCYATLAESNPPIGNEETFCPEKKSPAISLTDISEDYGAQCDDNSTDCMATVKGKLFVAEGCEAYFYLTKKTSTGCDQDAYNKYPPGLYPAKNYTALCDRCEVAGSSVRLTLVSKGRKCRCTEDSVVFHRKYDCRCCP